MRFLAAFLVLASLGCSSSNSLEKPLADPNQADPSSNNPNPVTQTTIINKNNADQVLFDAIAIINIDSVDAIRNQSGVVLGKLTQSGRDAFAGQPPMEGLELAAQSDVVNGDNGGYKATQDFTCSPTGSFNLKLDASLTLSHTNEVTFDQCVIAGTAYDGHYTRHTGRRSLGIDIYTAYRQTADDVTTTLSGERSATYFYASNADERFWKNVDWVQTSPTDMTTVKNMQWRRYGIHSPELNINYSVTSLTGAEQRIQKKFYKSEISAEFQLQSAHTQQTEVSVMLGLTFDQDYWDWSDYQPNDTRPDYPVFDLGTPLIIPNATTNGADKVINQRPYTDEAQWQQGSLRITAIDGSNVTLRPSTTDNSMLTIELNDSGELQERRWADGFHIDCSDRVIGCGSQ